MKNHDDLDAIKIPLEVLPNQSLTIRLLNDRYDIKLITISDSLMAISIVRNDVLLIKNQRVIPSVLILPNHKSKGCGNFLFYTPDDVYPYYKKFNNGHVLYFIFESANE